MLPIQWRGHSCEFLSVRVKFVQNFDSTQMVSLLCSRKARVLVSVGFSKQKEEEVDRNGKLERAIDGVSKEEKIIISKNFEHRNGKLEGQIDGISVGVSKKEGMVISKGLIGAAVDEILFGDSENDENVEPFVSSGRDSQASTRLPWEREGELGNGEGGKTIKKWSNTLSAEASLLEHELKRLRNVYLRMLERTKVGAAGITQGLVDAIHEKWKVDEVVKLKFEEPLSLNMKRTHGILESKTGGLVIWRSGSSVVLYRGISYNLLCVKSYTKHLETVDLSFHWFDSFFLSKL
ncbi:CRM-domain containing factor CFM3A, chloroplastic/mitochondrial-like [Rosa rugosa]|uniref:CRM-domain containing factor CFM3A, chloroplastic/mitochondrial-like n=1 Tax=Rosa rugosa TaxID=74645 RepID=UPI002B40F4D5|nr:CRM-domain containing factor CFM3A, chloroplastic/mitochondrial-like [Rosa rugosa]